MAAAGTGAPSYDGYTDWAKSLGVTVHESLEVRQQPRDAQVPGEEERGVYATKPFLAGTKLVSVPWAALLNVTVAGHCPVLAPLLDVALTREDDILAALLVLERAKGAESKWERHITVLPTVIHNVLFFSGLQLEALRGSSLYVIGNTLLRQVEADYAEIAPAIIGAMDKAGIDGKATFTIDAYRWGLANVFSRFASTTRAGVMLKCMVPFFDMFNHSAAGSKVSHSFDEASDCFVGTATEGFLPGEGGAEVHINYGTLSSHRMLMLYGMVAEENPGDSVNLWATMQPQAPDFAIKAQILKRHGIDDSLPFELGVSGDLNPRLLAALRVQQLNDAELPAADRAFDGDALSPRNEAAMLELLGGALKAMLSAYPTSAEEDEGMLAAWAASGAAVDMPVPQFHERMAVLMRMNEKRILAKHLAKVEEQQAALELARTEGGRAAVAEEVMD
jgi:hypothetical protein